MATDDEGPWWCGRCRAEKTYPHQWCGSENCDCEECYRPDAAMIGRELTRRWPAAPGQQAVVDVSWVPKPAADDYRPLMADKLRSGELLGPADLGRGDHR